MDNVSVTPGAWSLGVLIGSPIAALLILAALIAIVLILRRRIEVVDSYDRDSMRIGLAIVSVFTLFLLLFIGALYWPFSSEFHRYYKVSGPVSEVAKRQVAVDKAMQERYVLIIGGRPYAVDDTRAALVKPGDVVTLNCKREWVYNSDSGWACNWAQAR